MAANFRLNALFWRWMFGRVCYICVGSFAILFFGSCVFVLIFLLLAVVVMIVWKLVILAICFFVNLIISIFAIVKLVF